MSETFSEEFTAEESAALTPEPAPKVETPKVEQPPKVEKAEEPEKQKTVPHQALHAEREERKKAQAQLAELQRQIDALKPKEPEVTVDQDPIAVLKTLQEQVRKRDEAERQHQQAQASNQEFINFYREQAQAYAQENAQFKDAYEFLVNGRVAELEAVGFSKADATRMAENEERGIVLKAKQDGVNPGERLFAVAKVRGFAPKAPEKEKPDLMGKAVEKLDTIAKGMAAAGKSVASAPGGAEAPPSIEAILEMDENDLAKMDKKSFKKAMGG